MKRYLGYLLAISMIITGVVSFIVMTKKEEVVKSPINVYVFHKEQCTFCQNLFTYLEEVKADKSYTHKFNVVKYEVSNSNKTNLNLLYKVANSFDFTIKGVPFYVIGNTYFSGFADSNKENIKDAIDNAYNDINYKDYVDEIINGEKIEQPKKDNRKVMGFITLIVMSLFGVIFFIISSEFVKKS